ncbi:MAG: tripartite tricarboxylate transporter permease [Proteobacteria bacterium]|nr:tripartite tricarboxylate transporter permease [Pseudomonadota bacterium]
MDVLPHILHGFVVASAPENLLFLFIGAVLGTMIGMLPGIGPSAGIGLLLPATFGMEPLTALIMLAGIYYGAMYGNTASAVLINTPGTASAAMTTMDGYPMAKSGRAGAALAISAIASFIAGTIGIILLTLISVPMASFALQFGPAEYFALMIFAMTAVSALTGNSLAKGLIAACFGLMVGTIGNDLQSGSTRFTFGTDTLQEGIHLVVVLVGLFAVAEVLLKVEAWYRDELHPIPIKGRLWLTLDEWRRSVVPIVRGGFIGFFTGVLPGAGGAMATVISYSVEKRLSPNKAQFGKGAIEGVANPEAANNACTCGAFVPLLTLGVPGSGTTAVLLGAFILYGIQPGPMLFEAQPELVWGLIDSMYLGNVFLLILNLPLIGIFARLLYVPPGILLAIILGIASLGIYSLNASTYDLCLMVGFGAVGYAFRKLEIPVAPVILGLVLGPMMENSFRQAMAISDSDPAILVSSGISTVLIAMAMVSIAAPYIFARFKAWIPQADD